MKLSGAVAKELSKTRFYSATAYEKYVEALPKETPYVVSDDGCDVTVVGRGFCVKRFYNLGQSDHGDGFVSEGFGKTTGISAMCLYLGGGMFDEGGGLGVERTIVDVQHSGIMQALCEQLWFWPW